MRYLITSCAVALALAVPTAALAQSQPSKPLTGGNDQTALAGLGLTFMNAGDETGIGVAGNVLFNTLTTTGNGRIGIVGDLGINHFDGATVTTVMGGGRYTFTTNGKVIPYGQFLVGLVHAGDTNFDPALGFGVDIAWKPTVNFRAELSFIFHDNDDATRFFFGVSLPITKK